MHDDTRYHGTVLGQPAENRPVVIEGGPVSSVKAWHDMLKKQKPSPTTPNTSRRASSTLTSLGDDDVDMVEFEQDVTNHVTA